MQCTAKSKRSGVQCRNGAMPGFTKCRMHGGKTPIGFAAPSTKHLRYSKHLPKRLVQRYEEAVSDDELLALRDDIALLDSRVADLLSRVDKGEAGKLWTEAKSAFSDLKAAMKSADSGALLKAVDSLDGTLGRGLSDYAAWNEIHSLLDQRRRLVESERKRLVEMQQMVTSEQAVMLVSVLLDSVRRNVTDRNALSAIQTEFIQLISATNQQRVIAGGNEPE